MAGSSSPSCDIKTASLSPKMKPTDKKKRKRPSKKVPTTVLESSCTNFMDLVQKLTGSAAEVAANANATNSNSNSNSNSTTGNPHASETSSPYSSPSCDYIDPRIKTNTSSKTYYQQLLRSATMALYGDGDDESSSHSGSYPNPNAHRLPQEVPTTLAPDHFHQSPNLGYCSTGVADDDDFYSSYPSSCARAIENEISPFSSSWREPLTNHSEYWYQQMDAMRA